MIVGIGIDIVDVNEFQNEIDHRPNEWLERVFTSAEQTYCKNEADPYRGFAGTLAAKEAALKALGTGWTDQSDLRDVEVVRANNRPEPVLHRGALQTSDGLNVTRSFVSITYTRDFAAAVVVLEA